MAQAGECSCSLEVGHSLALLKLTGELVPSVSGANLLRDGLGMGRTEFIGAISSRSWRLAFPQKCRAACAPLADCYSFGYAKFTD